MEMVDQVGLEPTTNGLKARYSNTNWVTNPFYDGSGSGTWTHESSGYEPGALDQLGYPATLYKRILVYSYIVALSEQAPAALQDCSNVSYYDDPKILLYGGE